MTCGHNRRMGILFVLLIAVITAVQVIGKEEQPSGTATITGTVNFAQVVILAGSDLVLNCTLDGNIRIKDVWWKYNGEIFLSAYMDSDPCNFKQHWFVKKKTVQLIIPEVSPLTSGTYACGAVTLRGNSKYEWHSLGNEVLVDVIGEQFELADTECNAIGLREVNIRWKPITTFNSPTIYSVHFCKDLGTILYGEGNPVSQGYQFGCSRVVDRASLTGQYRQCDLGGPLQLQNVGEAFSYYIRANNSGKVYWSRRNTCRVTMKTQCTKLTGLVLEAKKPGELTLRWSLPRFMGDSVHSLYYQIFYSAEGAVKNKSDSLVGRQSATFSSLEPYTRFKFYIQCSIEKANSAAWGELAGPVEMVTLEEAPGKAPTFVDSAAKDQPYGRLRNVTVTWRVPPKKSWNGAISRFHVKFWQEKKNASNETIHFDKPVVDLGDREKTEGILTGLERFTDYICRVQMCTTAGCGPWSEKKRIRAELQDVTSRPQSSTGSSAAKSMQVIVAVAATISVLIFVCLALVVFCVCRTRRRNERRRRESLENMNVSLQSTDTRPSEGSTGENYYDETSVLRDPEPVAV